MKTEFIDMKTKFIDIKNWQTYLVDEDLDVICRVSNEMQCVCKGDMINKLSNDDPDKHVRYVRFKEYNFGEKTVYIWLTLAE